MTRRERRLLYVLGLLVVVALGRWLYPVGFSGAALAPAAGLAAAVSSGRVVAVHDGDTLTLLDASQKAHKIRLAQIDAPELSQPYGQQAKQALAGLAYGRPVSITVVTSDRYGRTVATVLVSGADINRTLVAKGAAWAYRAYLTDASLLATEQAAKQQHLGLWALPVAQQTPPWVYRQTESTQREKRK